MAALSEFLTKVKPEQRAVVRRLDALVRKAVPELASSIKWGNLTYHHERNVCSIIAHEHYINLQVWCGATIADPQGLLVGTGKKMRHIQVDAATKVNRVAIAAILKQAAEAARG